MSKIVKEIKPREVVLLQKPSGTVAISGKMTATERKIYNVLLKIAKETLKEDKEVKWFIGTGKNIKEMANIQETKEGTNNYFFKKSLEKLQKIIVKYNILEKDKIIDGKAPLITNLEIITDRKTGKLLVYFDLPIRIKEAFINKNSIYGKIDLMVIKGLNSRYAITLYELIKDYEDFEIPKMSIEKFREIFGVKDKYKRFQNLKARVIDPAVEEINSNSETIGYYVSYKLYKTGNKYTHIKFITEKINRKNKEKDDKKEVKNKEKEIKIQALINTIDRKFQKACKKILIKNNKSFGYKLAQIEYINNLKNIKNYPAMLKKALQENFAGWENDNWIDKSLGKIFKDKRGKIFVLTKIEEINNPYNKEKIYEISLYSEDNEVKIIRYEENNNMIKNLKSSN